MRKLIFLLLLTANTCFAGIWVTPQYSGSNADDSVVVSFCVFDTTLYPVLTDADSIVALRIGPDNSLVDSLDESNARLHHLRTGWYEVHYRAANPTSSVGTYRVFVRAYVGGDWRGAAAVSYEVIDEGVGAYFAQLTTQNDSIQDGLDEVIQLMPQLGSGAYPCTLFVFDETAATAISGATVTMFNTDESALVATGRTDSNGRLIFALDAGDYIAYGRALNYLRNSAATINVTSSGANDTLSLDRFDPGIPLDGNLCRVYGYVHDLHGDPIAEVVVKAAIPGNSLTANGAVISPFATAALTDTLGYWCLDLIPSKLIDPDTTQYDFSIYYPTGTILRRAITVPDSTNFWLK